MNESLKDAPPSLDGSLIGDRIIEALLAQKADYWSELGRYAARVREREYGSRLGKAMDKESTNEVRYQGLLLGKHAAIMDAIDTVRDVLAERGLT